MSAKKPTSLTHPDGGKVETHEPEVYLSQGWTEAVSKPVPSDD